ncbi:MAG TPA: GNAT family N-acetyltransferase [Thermoanaerobaculaceae bacterium]|nr:GNAT family N-acetyltransferase [Thermoanaerobaculaceae bacterium]
MAEIVYEVTASAPTEAVVELYRAGGWWREEPSWRASVPAMIRGSFCFLVARDPAGRIVAMGRVISDGASDAYIQDVVVLPGWRGRGIGREIVRRLAQRCQDAGLSWIGLIAEPGTQAFYEPLGFRALAGYVPMLRRDAADGR